MDPALPQPRRVITGEMTIEEVLIRWPKSAVVLLTRGLGCVGCTISSVESIGQGALSHGWTPGQVEELLDALNADDVLASEVKPSADRGLDVSEAAAAKLKDLMKAEGKEGFGVRVRAVLKNGAVSHEMDFEAKPSDGDVSFQRHGLTFFFDSGAERMLMGLSIDYKEGGPGMGFVLTFKPSA